MKLDLAWLKPRTRRLPTRADLDASSPKRRALAALGIFGTLAALAGAWWSRHGAELVQETMFHLETIRLHWTLVATPAEKTLWTWLIIGALLAVMLLLVLFHRFVWRAFFPDLARLDANTHTGGRPERVGRLYRVRAFQDGEATRYRHYYKHGNRWIPIFRFDHVDLDKPAEPVLHGVSLIRCGRLERDPSGNCFRRVANAEPFGAHPLATTFREKEVVEDQDRKASIVMPGPGMNPEVMRKKWASERLQTRWAAELENEEELDAEIEEALTRAERPR